MYQKDILNLWLIGSAVFLTLYTLSISSLILRIPFVNEIPNFLFTFALIFTYSTTLIKIALNNPATILSQSNFRSILLFLTFPNKVLLFPFYLLSIANTSKFITSNRKKYQNKWFYNLATIVVEANDSLKFAYECEIICCFLSALFLLIGKATIYTVLSYFFVVFSEIQTNPEMKKGLYRFLSYTDSFCEQYLPHFFKRYVHIKKKALAILDAPKSKTE